MTENDYRRALLALPYPVLVHTMDEIVFANLAACRVLDAGAPEALIGLSISSVSHADTRAAGHERRRVVIENKATVHVPLKLLTLEGRVCTARVWAHPFSCGAEDYIAVTAEVEGYAEQVETRSDDVRTTVTTPEGFYERALESLPRPCLVHDHDTVFYANAAARAEFQWTPQDLDAGCGFPMVSHPDGLASASERTAIVLATGRTMTDVPLKLLRKDGTVLTCTGSGARFSADGGYAVAVILLPE